MNQQQKVAFFDIDGTVFRSSLLIELVEALVREEVFPASARERYLDAYYLWQTREGSYEDYLEAVITSFRTHIRGIYYGDLADVGRQVVGVHSKRVYRYTRDLLRELKEEGYLLVAISQSPKTVLDEFCAQYGFDKVYGRVYELGPQDRFTGSVTDEHLIANKAAIVDRVFSRDQTLARSGALAVGDTESDIPLLEAVDRPVCSNPNATLYEHAKRRGWPIVVERKDVVYHI